MPNASKPKAPAYGLYVLDPAGIGLRCWLDGNRKCVVSVPITVPAPAAVKVYALAPINPQILADLSGLLTAWGYRTTIVDRRQAVSDLEWRYDCETVHEAREGPAAGVKAMATPARRTGRKRSGPRQPGLPSSQQELFT